MRPLQGPSDTLSRLLDDLCRPGALERATKDNERALAEFVEAEARDLSPEAFTKFMADIYYRIATLIKR
jgi:FKBP12-rapamycin complex-associated protein